MKSNYSYYWNGEEVSCAQASLLLARAAYQQGFETENWEPAFRSPSTEESRDFLFDVSNCQLEIVVH